MYEGSWVQGLNDAGFSVAGFDMQSHGWSEARTPPSERSITRQPKASAAIRAQSPASAAPESARSSRAPASPVFCPVQGARGLHVYCECFDDLCSDLRQFSEALAAVRVPKLTPLSPARSARN